jgi:prepilin-type N-terminal cleavage/methylation domain-containing protein
MSMRHRVPDQGRAGRVSRLGAGRAFTLLELLLVLAIIAIMAGVALPSMKGLQKSNIMANATRQLVDDLARARATAIRERTTVHVVFVPTNLQATLPNPGSDRGALLDRKQWTNLLSGLYTRYALYAERTVGDQPGQPHPRYLGDWHQLPEGVAVAAWEFAELPPVQWDNTPDVDRPLKFSAFPFPTVNGVVQPVPHLAFDATGALLAYDASGVRVLKDEVISLARASIFVLRDPGGAPPEVDYRESPPNNSRDNFNRIRIDALTGRTRVEQPEVQ